MLFSARRNSISTFFSRISKWERQHLLCYANCKGQPDNQEMILILSPIDYVKYNHEWFHETIREKLKAWNEQVRREFGVAVDTWHAGDLTFSLYSPVHSIPDPTKSSDNMLQKALVPAIFAERTIDNTHGEKSRPGFFGFVGKDPYSMMRRLEAMTEGQVIGIAQGYSIDIAGRGEGLASARHFSMEDILNRPQEQGSFQEWQT